MGFRDLFFVAVVSGGVGALGMELSRSSGRISPPAEAARRVPGLQPVVKGVDSAIRHGATGVEAPPASELAVARRLSLALTGSIPSLEEIRRFEARPSGSRLDVWLDDILGDRRCSDYLAERLARAFVGTEDGPFLVFRRRRFVAWLSDAILADRPYHRVVRDLIADRGLWTDHPATNFVSVTFDPLAQRPDPERLAARVSRAFLGTRIDCAQCHDHPFQPWKQADFRGLAAFFGGVRSNLRGITDGDSDYRPTERKGQEPILVPPRVPSRPELCPEGGGTARERLAAWVVDPSNPALALATVNRVWALLFGRPLVDPIDDLPPEADLPPALSLLAEDFAASGFDLHRLIRVIAATETFRRDSVETSPIAKPPDSQEPAWSSFPMTRLRPEQVAGALYQSCSVSTLGPQSPWLSRMIAFTSRNDFVRRYGDTGEDEFDSRGGTIPQRLLLMNGDLVRDRIKDDLFNASSRIASLAPDDGKAVKAAYLAVLTRRPSPEEAAHFADRLRGTDGQVRKDRLTDLYWTLLNSTEFSWNH